MRSRSDWLEALEQHVRDTYRFADDVPEADREAALREIWYQFAKRYVESLRVAECYLDDLRNAGFEPFSMPDQSVQRHGPPLTDGP